MKSLNLWFRWIALAGFSAAMMMPVEGDENLSIPPGVELFTMGRFVSENYKHLFLVDKATSQPCQGLWYRCDVALPRFAIKSFCCDRNDQGQEVVYIELYPEFFQVIDSLKASGDVYIGLFFDDRIYSAAKFIGHESETKPVFEFPGPFDYDLKPYVSEVADPWKGNSVPTQEVILRPSRI